MTNIHTLVLKRLLISFMVSSMSFNTFSTVLFRSSRENQKLISPMNTNYTTTMFLH